MEKEEPRTFEKFGKSGQVCNVKVKDDSGEIKLTLWNEDIEKVKVGDKIHLENGWCSEYQGEKQVSAGKFGKIEIVESSKEVYTNDPGLLAGGPLAEGVPGEETVEDSEKPSGDDDGDDDSDIIEEESIE